MPKQAHGRRAGQVPRIVNAGEVDVEINTDVNGMTDEQARALASALVDSTHILIAVPAGFLVVSAYALAYLLSDGYFDGVLRTLVEGAYDFSSGVAGGEKPLVTEALGAIRKCFAESMSETDD